MVNFFAKIVMSLSGFIATIVLTRTLGQEKYGTYVVIVSVLAWVAIAGDPGLQSAVRKRMSEATDGNYILAGAIVQFGLYAAVAVCLLISAPYLNGFLGFQATWALVVLLGARLMANYVQTILDGQHLVHLSSILIPIEWTGRSAVQVALVISGFGIAGALAGYVAGAIVGAAIGLYFTSISFSFPSTKEFAQLKSYVRFSWLASVKGRTFLSMDTIVLALFVSNSLIAVYEIAWNLASLFAIFGSSIQRTLFPEISKISSEEGINEEISELLGVSLSYSGLFIIPGLLGGAVVGDIVLQIYGEGFEQGYYLLLILTFSRLLYGYQGQFVNTLDAVDRPDLTFRINAAFLITNLSLNVILTSQFGWYGAAVATTASAALGLILAYYYASSVVDVFLPVIEIGYQLVSASLMAGIVYLLRNIVGESIILVLVFVLIGAAIYFASLFVLSKGFRTTVKDNLLL